MKIAILSDSGSDINLEKLDLPIFVLPLRIIIDGKEYTDKKDITLDEVLVKLEETKVTTSLPSPNDIIDQLDEIKALGYTHVIAIPISKGLSGTMNIIQQMTSLYDDLKIEVIDTKNISLGSGYSAILAGRLAKAGKSFDEIVKTVNDNLENQKVFFTVGSLENLKKGGRIGLVSATIASMLNIKPVISCNDKGVYYTVKKTRGYKHAITGMIGLAKDFVGTCKKYEVTLLNSQTNEDISKILEVMKKELPNATEIDVQYVTPALAIHTGKEALGIAISILEK
ncbi:DegV family protein [Alteracholeplasma palmae J233]|uniref:DegV family protein n=1 Tax=Alteracholeplasma palmae (strain ATCC 49389 / J233) TaxID=1318466 RepID=U4KLF5_ALTPJ|nr:DegV family protein [Alteracholeplasma palmae]CCV64662.1 DegV family protein [Alteracholeplasma palmae J233]